MTMVICLVACPSDEVALEIARSLVNERLAACGNVTPKTASVYLWKGEVVTAEEALLTIKTAHHLTERVRIRVGQLHPYEVPEFVVLTPTNVSPEYAMWLNESVLTGS